LGRGGGDGGGWEWERVWEREGAGEGADGGAGFLRGVWVERIEVGFLPVTTPREDYTPMVNVWSDEDNTVALRSAR